MLPVVRSHLILTLSEKRLCRQRREMWRFDSASPWKCLLGARLAGLWDCWRSPAGETIKSFAIVTTTANALLAPLHDRMPIVIAPDSWDIWLGEKSASDATLGALMRPYPGNAMAFWAVDRRVGNVRNDSPDLFAPLNGRQDTGDRQ
jgi:putative SOS response-associated peptidase YedK